MHVVATPEIEHDVAEAYSSSEGDSSVKLDVAQPIEVDGNQVGRATVDRQRLPAAVHVAARIKHMDALAVDGEQRARTGIQCCVAVYRNGCPRIAENRLRQRVNEIESVRNPGDAVVHAAGNHVSAIIVVKLSSIGGREVDATVDGGRAAVGHLPRA